jgi:site-specific DNA-methyltransferase (adenine-specific)
MIDLRLMDWRDLLPKIKSKSIDCVLTDCPYGMNWQGKQGHDKIVGDDNLDWLPDWAAQLRRIVKDDSHLYIFCSWHKVEVFKMVLQRHFEIKNMLVWYKRGGGMGDLKGGYGGCHELILFINNGKDLNGKRDTDVIDKAYRTGNEHHPTEKPINLMSWLISKSSNPGDLVLDSFAGAGSTALACHETGRNFIGCELVAEYYNTAQRRIKAAQAQLAML